MVMVKVMVVLGTRSLTSDSDLNLNRRTRVITRDLGSIFCSCSFFFIISY